MSDCPDSERWADLLDERVDASEREALEDHLSSCDACCRVIDALAAGSWGVDSGRMARPLGPPVGSESLAMFERLANDRGLFEDPDSDPSVTPPPPPSIPGFEILGEVGTGGMGVVYKARQVALDRIVAIKRIVGGDRMWASYRTRFRREAKALARISHPSIVHVYGVGTEAGRPYMIMEWVDGGSLDDLLAKGPLPITTAATIARKLATGLHAMHALGVIHRDLKPANIFLNGDDDYSRDGSVKIGDFGLAKLVDDDAEVTFNGVAIGTPSYMAPEQTGLMDGVVHGPLTDVYGLGAVLYAMLTGRPPFKGPSNIETIRSVATRPIEPPKRVRKDIPRVLEAICLKCMGREPSQRYGSAEEVADALGRFLDGIPSKARRERPRSRKVIVTIAALGICVLAGASAYYWRSTPPAPVPPGRSLHMTSAEKLSLRSSLAKFVVEFRMGVELRQYHAAHSGAIRVFKCLRALCADDPLDLESRIALVEHSIHFYHLCRDTMHLSEAEPYLREAVAMAEGLYRRTPGDFALVNLDARTCYAMGEYLNISKEHDKAEEWLNRGLDVLKPWYEIPPYGIRARGISIGILTCSSDGLNAQGRKKEADARWTQAHELVLRNEEETSGKK